MKLLLRIAILFCIPFADNMPVIDWILVTDVIVFNESVQLKCNIERAIKSGSPKLKKWKKLENNIVYNGTSVDEHKYKQLNEEKSFSLIIKKFDVSDVDVTYTCIYGFEASIKLLTLNNASSFELQPTTQSVSSETFTGNGKASFHVIFKAVYPLPECSLLSETNDLMSANIDVFPKQIGIFFEAVVIKKDRVTFSNGEEEVLLRCKVGTRTHDMLTLNKDDALHRSTEKVSNCKACWIMATLSVIGNVVLVILLLLTRFLPTNFCMTSFSDSRTSDSLDSYVDIFTMGCFQNCRRLESGSSSEVQSMNAVSSE